VTLAGNTAANNGGAFYLFRGTVTVEDCVASGNAALAGTLAYRELGQPNDFIRLGNTTGLEGTVVVGP
jgi:hypothetical protein